MTGVQGWGLLEPSRRKEEKFPRKSSLSRWSPGGLNIFVQVPQTCFHHAWVLEGLFSFPVNRLFVAVGSVELSVYQL